MIQNHKDRLARLIKAHLGADILRQIQEQPGWHNDMHVTREKLACRTAIALAHRTSYKSSP
jgi:hypothetical protein